MTGSVTYTNLPVFCTAGNKVQPDSAHLTIGYQPQEQLPCEWYNYMEYALTDNVTIVQSGLTNVIAELDTIVTSGGLTPSGSATNQVATALANLYYLKTAYGANWTTVLSAALGSNWATALNAALGSNWSTALGTAVVSGIVTFLAGNADTSNLVLENRTSDPASPALGRIWLRTDL